MCEMIALSHHHQRVEKKRRKIARNRRHQEQISCTSYFFFSFFLFLFLSFHFSPPHYSTRFTFFGLLPPRLLPLWPHCVCVCCIRHITPFNGNGIVRCVKYDLFVVRHQILSLIFFPRGARTQHTIRDTRYRLCLCSILWCDSG